MKSFPQAFLDRLKELGHEAYERLPEIISASEPVTSVRINPAKNPECIPPFPVSGKVEWNTDGFYLKERPAFTSDPRLHQGLYYVQEASSMAIRAAIERALSSLEISDRPLRYLDACAAPGGKTLIASDALPSDAFIAANEFDSKRAYILKENLAKWGLEALITVCDASTLPYPSNFFDIIAADVPCSGEGMMRKDSFAIEQWSTELVTSCSRRQLEIVDQLWKMLRPGGFMIYSTCTFNLDENEKIIKHIIDDFNGIPIPINFSDNENILGAMGGFDFPAYRFVPDAVHGEGLFIALIQKPADGSREALIKPLKNAKRVKSPINPSSLLKGDYTILDDSLQCVRCSHLSIYETLIKRISPLSAGLLLGTIKGKDFIPSQPLALSRNYRRGAFPEHDIDVDTALNYLRHETVTLPPDAPKGIILLTYQCNPLGWVKNLGSRANNLYPEHWRIRN